MDDYPHLQHHGAANGVTGSCHRLQVAPDRALLVDCGLFQGDETGADDPFERLQVEFPVNDILALIVTHVHIDHVGRLPYLLAAGYKGPIVCSVPSARLLPLVIEDALKVGFTRDRVLIRRFLDEVESRLVPLDYKCWHTVIDDSRHSVRVKLQRAGHILGSAYVEVDSLDSASALCFPVILGRLMPRCCPHHVRRIVPIPWCWKAPTAIAATRIAAPGNNG